METVFVTQSVNVVGTGATAITIPAQANARIKIVSVAGYPAANNYNGIFVRETNSSGTVLFAMGSETSGGAIRFSGVIMGTVGLALYVALETPQAGASGNNLSVTWCYERV